VAPKELVEAVMNRSTRSSRPSRPTVPRTRGDEPVASLASARSRARSPHARG